MARQVARRASARPPKLSELIAIAAFLITFGTAAATATLFVIGQTTPCVLTGAGRGDTKEFVFLAVLLLGGLLAGGIWLLRIDRSFRLLCVSAVALIIFGVMFTTVSKCTCDPRKGAEAWFNQITFGNGLAFLCIADLPRR